MLTKHLWGAGGRAQRKQAWGQQWFATQAPSTPWIPLTTASTWHPGPGFQGRRGQDQEELHWNTCFPCGQEEWHPWGEALGYRSSLCNLGWWTLCLPPQGLSCLDYRGCPLEEMMSFVAAQSKHPHWLLDLGPKKKTCPLSKVWG